MSQCFAIAGQSNGNSLRAFITTLRGMNDSLTFAWMFSLERATALINLPPGQHGESAGPPLSTYQ